MDGRAIRVAVIGPEDLTAEVAGIGRDLGGVEVWPLPYEKVDEAESLYALACGRGHGAGPGVAAGGDGHPDAVPPGLPGTARPADAVLFTGPIGYHRGTHGEPAAGVPTAHVPYSPLWLYAPLFAVAERRSLSRVSLDSLDRGVLEATYRELGLRLEAVEVYGRNAETYGQNAATYGQNAATYGQNVAPETRDEAGAGVAGADPSPEEVVDFHRRSLASGRATHALTCILAVYQALKAAGLPATWLVPSRVALKEALEKLVYVAEGVRARGAQIVVGLVRIVGDGPIHGASRAARLRLKAHELLLSEVEEFDGHLVDPGSGDFQFFATRARFERATGFYTQWPLGDKLDGSGLAMSAGVGLGATAGEAGVNAIAALEEALRAGSSACFVMLENRRLIGPLGPGALAYSVRNIDRALVETAGELGTTVASLARALAALGDLDGANGSFTARDLALRLRVGLRSAHRILSRLREAGYLVEVGQESAGTRGRPRRVFRLAEGLRRKEEEVAVDGAE